ncbi:MAG: Maf family protein [Acetobacteraceae bacterium]
MPLQRERPELVLASASTARAMLLAGAGLAFAVHPAIFDEPSVREDARGRGLNARETALLLAAGKAEAVSRERPEALVIGGDQVLVCGDVWFTKSAGRAEAADQLRALRGRTHRLLTAVACRRAGEPGWEAVEEARVTFRDYSDALLEAVLEADGGAIGASVGSYRLEGPGVQLCERIEGDHSSILGLPLLPLLRHLRARGVLLD